MFFTKKSHISQQTIPLICKRFQLTFERTINISLQIIKTFFKTEPCSKTHWKISKWVLSKNINQFFDSQKDFPCSLLKPVPFMHKFLLHISFKKCWKNCFVIKSHISQQNILCWLIFNCMMKLILLTTIELEISIQSLKKYWCTHKHDMKLK